MKKNAKQINNEVETEKSILNAATFLGIGLGVLLVNILCPWASEDTGATIATLVALNEDDEPKTSKKKRI